MFQLDKQESFLLKIFTHLELAKTLLARGAGKIGPRGASGAEECVVDVVLLDGLDVVVDRPSVTAST